MDRIIGKDDKYITTAVIVPIVSLGGEEQMLFERRSPDIPQGDEVCFPGGRVDRSIDSSSQQAAIRETCEELGLSRDKIVVHRYVGTILAPLGVAVDAFMGELTIDSLDEVRPNEREVESVFCIPIAWFKQHEPEEYHVRIEVQPFEIKSKDQIEYLLPVRELGLPERYEKPWGGRKLPVYVYRTRHGVIWGITAEIVRDLLKSSEQVRRTV
jgi:8-oxo-dGTP pyrophosphatase MutT (NUDIX family)